MAESLGNYFRVNTSPKGQGGMAMPQVMQADLGKTGAANQSVEQFREAIRMDQRTVLSDEDMTGVGPHRSPCQPLLCLVDSVLP